MVTFRTVNQDTGTSSAPTAPAGPEAPPVVERRFSFGTDGWRGRIADDFTYEAVRYLAQGSADYLNSRLAGAGRPPRAVVGYDFRFASEHFGALLARILVANGLEAILVDRACPTQLVSWTVIDRRADGGMMITASHNPYTDNGFKYKPETGSSAPPEVIAELEAAINAAAARGPGAVSPPAGAGWEVYDPRPAYHRQVGRVVDLEALRGSGIRILHECMHGSGSGYVRELLAGGTAVVDEIHAERNPFFGGFNPEPIPPNLEASLALMRRGGHDLAICTDGDADRVGIIDETGRFVNQLQVYALLMKYLFEVRGLRGPVVRTVNMTHMADRLAEAYGTEVHEVPVGFKNIAPRMLATGAVLGGEESGGYAIAGHIPERDGILVGLLFADMITRTGRPLSRLLADLEAQVGPHAYARHDHHLPRETYSVARRRILERLGGQAPEEVAGVAVTRVRSDDGFKFYLADGSWVLLRSSGTEPLIRIYAEAADPEAVEARIAALERITGLGPAAA